MPIRCLALALDIDPRHESLRLAGQPLPAWLVGRLKRCRNFAAAVLAVADPDRWRKLEGSGVRLIPAADLEGGKKASRPRRWMEVLSAGEPPAQGCVWWRSGEPAFSPASLDELAAQLMDGAPAAHAACIGARESWLAEKGVVMEEIPAMALGARAFRWDVLAARPFVDWNPKVDVVVPVAKTETLRLDDFNERRLLVAAADAGLV